MGKHFTTTHPALNKGCEEIVLLRIMKYRLGNAWNGCQPSQYQTMKLLGADASPKPKQTNKHNADVNNSSTVVFRFSKNIPELGKLINS